VEAGSASILKLATRARIQWRLNEILPSSSIVVNLFSNFLLLSDKNIPITDVPDINEIG